jgi:hypothetical protein
VVDGVVAELAAAQVDAEHDGVVVGGAVRRPCVAVVGLELRVVVDDRWLVGVDVPLRRAGDLRVGCRCREAWSR